MIDYLSNYNRRVKQFFVKKTIKEEDDYNINNICEDYHKIY